MQQAEEVGNCGILKEGRKVMVVDFKYSEILEQMPIIQEVLPKLVNYHTNKASCSGGHSHQRFPWFHWLSSPKHRLTPHPKVSSIKLMRKQSQYISLMEECIACTAEASSECRNVLCTTRDSTDVA